MVWEGRLVVKAEWLALAGRRGSDTAKSEKGDAATSCGSENIATELSLALQICGSDDLPPLPPTLRQTAFANPQLIPLWSIQTPEFAVYSQDPAASKFFGKLSAHNVGVLARTPQPLDAAHSVPFDHIFFYAVKEAPPRVCARPLYLQRRELVAVPSGPAPAAPASEPAPIVPSQCGIDGPRKALQQTILGAMRLRGIERSHRDFKSIYQHCLRAAEFALRNHAQPISLDAMQDKVEALLSILE